jgi:hypothetical protein
LVEHAAGSGSGSGSDQQLVILCKESSVHGAARLGAAQHLVVHGRHDSAHQSQITESSSNLESVDKEYL